MIIAALKQMEGGRLGADIAREVGVGKHTICAWKVSVRWAPSSRAQGIQSILKDGDWAKRGSLNIRTNRQAPTSLEAGTA